MKTNKIAILGSTGSIGRQTADVARSLGLQVTALTAGRNAELMIEQALEFRPRVVAMADPEAAGCVRQALAGYNIAVLSGEDGIVQAAADCGAELVVSAIVGIAGLRPTAAAIEQGVNIGLANKETLVTAGQYITRLCERCGVQLLPIDSEHSAIFQSLAGQPRRALRRILLTASGGPFFGYTAGQLATVTPEQALKHPNWSMGSRITVDSASMMNKGFEVIEAMWLFGVSLSQIEVVVHRQSIIHSAVEFEDGAVLAQLGTADMRLPIQYAITYPDRLPGPARQLDIFSCGPLTFERPDESVFRCLAICRRAAALGGLAPAAVNAADEVAVAAYLQGRIGFDRIAVLAEQAMQSVPPTASYNIDDVLRTDATVRLNTEKLIRQSTGAI